MFVLKNLSGQNPDIRLPLINDKSTAFIGRNPFDSRFSEERGDKLIFLPHDLSANFQSPVSRLHFMVQMKDGVLYLTNLSTIGTFVNGKRLTQNETVTLRHLNKRRPGDVVCLQRSPRKNEQHIPLKGSLWEYKFVRESGFAPESKRISYDDEDTVESFTASMQIVEETTKTKTSVDNNIKLTRYRVNGDLEKQVKANQQLDRSVRDIFDAMMTEPSCRQQQAQLDQAPPCEACTQAHRDFHNKRKTILGPSARKSQRVIKCSDCKSRSQEFFHMCHALQGSRDENKKLKRQLEESQKALQAALESQFNESQDAFQALKHQRT